MRNRNRALYILSERQAKKLLDDIVLLRVYTRNLNELDKPLRGKERMLLNYLDRDITKKKACFLPKFTMSYMRRLADPLIKGRVLKKDSFQIIYNTEIPALF